MGAALVVPGGVVAQLGFGEGLPLAVLMVENVHILIIEVPFGVGVAAGEILHELRHISLEEGIGQMGIEIGDQRPLAAFNVLEPFAGEGGAGFGVLPAVKHHAVPLVVLPFEGGDPVGAFALTAEIVFLPAGEHTACAQDLAVSVADLPEGHDRLPLTARVLETGVRAAAGGVRILPHRAGEIHAEVGERPVGGVGSLRSAEIDGEGVITAACLGNIGVGVDIVRHAPVVCCMKSGNRGNLHQKDRRKRGDGSAEKVELVLFHFE